MATKGPAPLPTAVKRLRGSEPREINKTEPRAPKGIPVAPAWLPEGVKLIFQRIALELHSMGLASPVDADNLIAYSQAIYEHQRASALIAKQGIILFGKEGQPVRNPACVITQQTSAVILRYAREFGLTPSARTAMGTKYGEPVEADSERLLA